MIPEQLPELDLIHASSIREAKIPLGPIVSQEICEAHEYKKDGKSFVNQYEIMGYLGEGAYGKVKKVQRSYKDENGQPTKSLYAMKIYDKMLLQKNRFFGPDMQMINGRQVLENQLNIIKTLDHCNIVKCYQIIDDYENDKVFMIMDLCDLGQIMNFNQMSESYVRNQKVMNYIKNKYAIASQNPQDYARIIFRELALAISYLHERNITHRDIKVDNIFMRTQSQGYEVKLGDFTTARYSDDDVSYQTIGTNYYRSPEQQFATEHGYSSRGADIWSFGITLYLFCFQKFPFTGESELQIDIKALNDAIQFPSTASEKLVQLIKKTTMKQSAKRPPISDILADPWFSLQ